ncbi:heterokaryon incompatibility protein-domain-containing protein [Podospora conica]|nr:heterokaryon incompatibility protein-domain-containing protein [Schizothecium conicum]
MRLLSTHHETLTDFPASSPPRYAILSHTWGTTPDSEVTFRDLTTSTSYQTLPGYPKLQAACAVARREGFDWIWIDTCCIDKSSSAELSEAINSMFDWYRGAAVCYAYLADVYLDGGDVMEKQFAASRWFTRGWTLQELVAPSVVVFLDAAWLEMGTRSSLVEEIAAVTGIDDEVLAPVLKGGRPERSVRAVLDSCSIAQRMSWASGRKTTRVEDAAYSLMGLFDVNMPLLYGEGQKAFVRLQREIMNQSDDMSVFAWRYPHRTAFMRQSGLLAPSAECFRDYGEVRPRPWKRGWTPKREESVPVPFGTSEVSKNRVRLHIPLLRPPASSPVSTPTPGLSRESTSLSAELAHRDRPSIDKYHDLVLFQRTTLASPFSELLAVAMLDCWSPAGQIGIILRHSTSSGHSSPLVRCHLPDSYAPLLLENHEEALVPLAPREDVHCSLVVREAIAVPRFPVHLPWVRFTMPLVQLGYGYTSLRRTRNSWVHRCHDFRTGAEVEFPVNNTEVLHLLFVNEGRKAEGFPPFLVSCSRYPGEVTASIAVLVLEDASPKELDSNKVLTWRDETMAMQTDTDGRGGESQIRIPLAGKPGRELVVKNRPSPSAVDVVLLVEG